MSKPKEQPQVSGQAIEISDRTTVAFQLPGGEIRVNIREGRLRVSGETEITLKPQAANLVQVEINR